MLELPILQQTRLVTRNVPLFVKLRVELSAGQVADTLPPRPLPLRFPLAFCWQLSVSNDELRYPGQNPHNPSPRSFG